MIRIRSIPPLPRSAYRVPAASLLALTLGGCASLTKDCPSDPRVEAPWWCAVGGVSGGTYEDEVDKAGERTAEEERALDEERSRIDADESRLETMRAENRALAAELDGLRGEVRTAERRVAALREAGSRSESELATLESRLESIDAEIESLRAMPDGGAGSEDIARGRERRAELEAELQGIIETLGR